MSRGLIVAGLVLSTSVPWAAAEPRERDRRRVDAEVLDVLAVIGPLAEALGATEARTREAPRLLAEALRSGNTDTAAWASIVRWVLFEKEEKVAAGLTEALRAVPAPTSGPDAERWNRTAEVVIGAFAGVLRDAQTHTRRDGDAIVNDLVMAAAPAVMAALREADPAALDKARAAIAGFAPGTKEMVGPLARGLHHPDASVRAGAATALGALGSSAGDAVPELRAALDDPEASVREAAAAALRRIQPE
jgi:HEAT repeat protein